MKSDGDFEDILADDNPAIWHANRPAKGGDTGAAFEKIIARAAEIKAGRGARTEGTTRSARAEDTKVTKDAKGTRSTKNKPTRKGPAPKKKVPATKR